MHSARKDAEFSSWHNQKDGGAGESRTPDKQFRKLLLYPSELQPRFR